MSQSIANRVVSIIAKAQHLSPESVTIESTFEELKIDSLDGINIVFAIEEEFGIEIPDDQAKLLRSVRDAVDGVTKLVADKSIPATEGI